MHILISNDDGYSAKGLAALNEAMIQVAETTVVAPERNRSCGLRLRPVTLALLPGGLALPRPQGIMQEHLSQWPRR